MLIDFHTHCFPDKIASKAMEQLCRRSGIIRPFHDGSVAGLLGLQKKDGVDYREILKVDKVIEVSAVNFPAYGGTNINSRSLDSDRRALENARTLLDNGGKSVDYKTRNIILKYKGAKTK